MGKLIATLTALMFFFVVKAQISRTDSISGLINSTVDLNEKARLFILAGVRLQNLRKSKQKP